MDRLEVWEHIIQALEDHFTSGEFEPGEFEVAHNNGVGTITIIHRRGHGSGVPSPCMALQDVTGSHYTGDPGVDWKIIMPTGELMERLHNHRD